MLLGFFKNALAPALASYALVPYWRGDYRKSHALLAKAIRWNPDLAGDSLFEALLGLGLFHLGEHAAASPHLFSAHCSLNKVSSFHPEMANVEQKLLMEINEILSSAPLG